MRQKGLMTLYVVVLWLGAGTTAWSKDAELDAELKSNADGALNKASATADRIKAVHQLVKVAARIGEEGRLSKAFRTKVEEAAAQSSAFEQRAIPALNEAYAALNGGRSFAFPDVSNMDDTVAYGRQQVERASKALKAGRHEEAARELTGFILLVATPQDM
jgi:hypothetical protein